MAKREAENVPLSRLGVLVAQLESIAAAARQQPPDALLCFDLLSELVAAIEEEPQESILQWQRKCEDALYSLLILGARRPVRRLASSAMAKVIAKGDGISIYSRASSLQGWLADGKRSEPLSCAGAAQCLGELYRLFGRRITSGLVETTNIASKLMKFHEDFVRQDALQMLENALEGCGGNGVSTAYSEAFRIIMRMGVNDKSYIVRLAAARCLKTFASIGGPELTVTELESSITYSLKALEDPLSSVRDVFSEALGALLALAMNPEAQVKQRGKSLPGPGKKLEDVLQKFLIFPFTRASGIRMKTLRVGLALAWVYFLQVIHLKYHFPDSEIESFASQAMNMLQGNASMDAHALACVLYILRVGITDQMTEPTQRIFLVHLAKKLESADYSPPVGVAVLRILSYLLTTLGEVPVEFKEVLDDTVVAALSHSSLHVRIEAALTLRALAEVDPTCVGGLISFGVTTLHALRESAAIGKGNNLNLDLDSLHGQATVLAALVSISPKLVLGYPSRLPKSVFEVSRKMLTDFSRLPAAACVEKEAGWLLLASLISSMPKEELDDQVFDVLLLWAGPFVGDPEFHISRMQDLNSEIHVLSAAIEALTAFIRSFLFPAVVTTNGAVFLQPVVAYLSGALSYISSFAAKQLPNLKPALDLFTIRTLMAYQTLLNPMTYKREHHQILQLCSTPFSDPSKSEESSCLRVLLDKRDACLGPWIPGRDWFEDELRAFDGSIDGILPCVWDDVVSSFPQPESISKMLVNQKLLCFGTIFASQDSKGKLQLLNMIDHCLKTGKKQSWHVASVTNACVALLTGLKAVLALRPQTFEVELLSSIQSIFQGILADGEICVAQRRASAEGLGLLARLGNDIFTARMMRSLLGDLSVATDPNYIGSIAFSLGCIHRCAGGMALSTLVPATVTSISTLARSSNPGLQLFSLHALLLTIEAAGLSYVSQVQATLFLAIEVLLSEESGLVDLRQEIGRLINAIVAVLGPELAPGSTFFSRCKSVIAEISTSKETSSLLESVRFTQQLVLFAPHAVPVHHHVQGLLSTLFSRQPSLRHLAVSTLRHLIEKDPVTMTDEQVEEHLFSMLDEETDTEIASLIRATIIRLLYTSCSSCPSRWLTILHNMVLATSKRRKAVEYHTNQENGHIGGASEGDAKLYYGEDDEDMISGSGGEQMQSSVSFSNMNTKRDMHLRYTTRVFAAECLSHLPMAVGTDPMHFDLSLSRRHPYKGSASSGDWLVLHLQEMISLSYQISTGQFESMQPIGVKLLSIIMDKFGKSPDPELPGHLLLEQYQAQLVSAVRSSISMSSGPLLLEAGLQLATKILTSSIICEDRVALNRMFSLILRPLNDIQDLYYPSFAEWVACKIKVRLLAAHASIKCYVYSFLREQKGTVDEYLQLIPQFSNSSSKLGTYWIDVLKDHVHICFCLQSKPRYKPFLDGIKSSLVSSKVQECLEEAWPLILQATVLDAAPVKFEFDRTSKNRVEDKPEDVFISGHIMVRLEPKDFQFIWGLALFALFQQHQSDTGKQGKALPTHLKKKESGDSVLQEKHEFVLFDIPLSVLQSMSKRVFFNQEFLDLDLCMELIQVLIYADYTDHLLNCLVIYILSQIVQFCQDGFFETEDFTFAAFELCLKCLSVTLQSDSAGGKDLLSELSIIAERIANCMDHKNQVKVIISLISICYECFKGASTESCISKLVAFLWSILPFIKKCFQAQLSLDEYTHLKISLGTWASMLSFLSQDCIRRMHLVENKMSSSFKLLAKILASCLEEAIALARLVHETQCLGQKRESHMLLVSVFKCCIKCIQDTFYDTIIQVRAIGLHVLKSISQRELAEGTQMRTHSFFLLLCGELFGDLFLLIQNILRHDTMNRDSIAVIEECLRLLFVVHTLSQASGHLQDVTRLLLEALILVFSAVDGRHQEELSEVKTISRRLVAHLVQSPSNTILIKDVMLSMSVTRRQQLQDMIRASVTQTQMATQTSTSIQNPINKLNMQPDPRSADQQLRASDFISVDANKPGATMEVDDDDEDWDAFQSLPADNASVPISDSCDDNTGFKTNVDQLATASNLHVQVCADIDDGKDLRSNEGNHMTNLDSAELEEPLDSYGHYDDHVVDSVVGGHDQEFFKSYQPSRDANESPDGHSAKESGVIVTECTSNIDDTTRSVNHSSNINEELSSEQLEGTYGEGDDQESGVIVMECTSNIDDTTTSVNHSSNINEELISEQLESIYGEGDTQELLHTPSTEESEERIRCTSNVDDVIGPAPSENFENNKDMIGERSDEIHGEVLLVGSNAESEERTVGCTESRESSGQTLENDEELGKEQRREVQDDVAKTSKEDKDVDDKHFCDVSAASDGNEDEQDLPCEDRSQLENKGHDNDLPKAEMDSIPPRIM